METITLTKSEKAFLLDMLDIEAMIIQQYKGTDPIAHIENEQELEIINSICDRLQLTM